MCVHAKVNEQICTRKLSNAHTSIHACAHTHAHTLKRLETKQNETKLMVRLFSLLFVYYFSEYGVIPDAAALPNNKMATCTNFELRFQNKPHSISNKKCHDSQSIVSCRTTSLSVCLWGFQSIELPLHSCQLVWF